jgi:polyphenol oxidase
MQDVDLGRGVVGWFTGRATGPAPAVGQAGNLSSRRPHQPAVLAAERVRAFGRHGLRPEHVHVMRQVHGTRVATVSHDVRPGVVLGDVDAAVTTVQGRGLAVLTADCLPVLVAGERAVGVAHAGRRGLFDGVLQATVGACQDLGEDITRLRAVIGPAIGGCCYEVSPSMQEELAAARPEAAATTTWGTPSLDLAAVATSILTELGAEVTCLDVCTRCGSDQWFSHRADSRAGRQAGVIARVETEDGA